MTPHKLRPKLHSCISVAFVYFSRHWLKFSIHSYERMFMYIANEDELISSGRMPSTWIRANKSSSSCPKLKGNFYSTTIVRNTSNWVTCSKSECCEHENAEVDKCGNMLRDRMRNECIQIKLHITPTKDKMRKNWLNKIGHVQQRATS